MPKPMFVTCIKYAILPQTSFNFQTNTKSRKHTIIQQSGRDSEFFHFNCKKHYQTRTYKTRNSAAYVLQNLQFHRHEKTLNLS